LKKGKLIVFSAPSGSGKTTLVQFLLQQKLPLGFSISATSRKARGKEENGKDYYFLTEKAFRKKIKEEAFVEFEEVYKGTFYGTLKSELERLWNEGKHVMFDIDVVGGLNIKKKYPDNTLSLFIQPPSLKVLEQRLKDRGTESEKKIQLRLAKSEKELTYSKHFDHVILNDDLELAKKQVLSLVQQFLDS